MNRQEIEHLAIDLRKRFGEDGYSPIDVFALVQRIPNLTLIKYPLGEHISGYCRKTKHTNIIVINSSHTKGRQRFSLSHELYHLFYDDSMTSFVCSNFNNKSENERKADLFASYFLMPPVSLFEMYKQFKQIALNYIISIEQYYQISHVATLYRLLNDKKITNEQLEDYKVNVIISAKNLGYSEDLYTKSSDATKYIVLGKYIKDAQALLENNKISNGKFEEILLDAFRDDLVYGSSGGETVD